ncbi:Mucoidy inhibitor A [Madurella fahalii]|uniref:Mucoidy inhibitor A n=1 Tax=Madurella fahalii TaxID=1157608 RepID=A0ABQ0GLM2_9PEZI
MDDPQKQVFHVRDLPTGSVTLFPTRAQITRDLKNVSLKPGANEITVIGVTPTADEHSIKVEGTGSAIITDITVELLPNRDIFQEIYPDSDSESDKDESDDEDDDEEKVNDALEEIREKLVVLSDEQKRAKERIASAESRLRFLDGYGKSLEKKPSVEIEPCMETYRTEREKVFKDHMEGTARDRELTKEITKLRREELRLWKLDGKAAKKAAKAKAKVKKAKAKLQEKQRRRDQERQKEKTRIRKEREQFWPRFCYSVRITLDATNFTPGSSRRTSVASLTDVKVISEKENSPADETASLACDLSLSYVTSSAFWSPSYDLALSTTTNTATLCFDARLTNMTSETWSNSRVILSTSQANFSGLQDDIPSLVPWRLKLAGRGGPWDGFDIAHSREERAEKEVYHAAQNALVQQKPRANLFGVSDSFSSTNISKAPTQPKMAAVADSTVFGKTNAGGIAPQAQQVGFGAQQPQGYASGGLFGGNVGNANVVPAASVFGSKPTTAPPGGPFGGGLFGGGAPPDEIAEGISYARKGKGFNLSSVVSVEKSAKPVQGRSSGPPQGSADYYGPGAADEADEADDADGQTMLEPTPEVAFQDSSFEETGLTATYDLPNLKTLKPSSTASKQRIARISFSNVVFSRTVVAKYKPAAYLKARLRNMSKLTLLRGPTGLTLDGTFMGRSTLPRCSAGDSFNMPLGVDPAIRVAYPKPDVTRSTTGVFSKGDNSVYTRTITLVNTRATAGKPVSITVLDQVPVSEDEKLKVDVLHPAGLAGGKAVATGVAGKDGKDEKEWGRATAMLKKAGEVSWDVMLNAGKSVKLTLQYEVAFPTGERVAQC